MRPGKCWLLVMVVGLVLMAAWSFAAGKEPPRIDKESVRDWVGNPDVLILDVRQPADWSSSGKKIKGAVRQDPKALAAWAASLPKDKKIVLYCA